MKKSGIDIKKKLADTLEIPRELFDDITKISILGFREISILNYKSLIEYENNIIRINTRQKIIKITGRGLVLKNITDDELFIEGEIGQITFD